MSPEDDRPTYLDRDKPSFSELDRARRDRRSGHEAPKSPAAQARTKQATKQYLGQIDALFAGGSGGEAEKLAAALWEARGTPGLDDACRAYREALGLPRDARHIACFLDAVDVALLRDGLAALRAAHEAGDTELGAGLRTQLRMLADHADDDVAADAEELLELG